VPGVPTAAPEGGASTASTPVEPPAAGGDAGGGAGDDAGGDAAGDAEGSGEGEGAGGGMFPEDPLLSCFYVKESGTTADVLYIPSGNRVNTGKFIQVYEYWQKVSESMLDGEDPGTLITCDAGTVHPKLFATAHLANPDIGPAGHGLERVFWDDAKAHAKRAGWEGDADATLDIINNVVWVKMGTIFNAILEAAQTANQILIVDRTPAGSKSPSGDLLIEYALTQTTSRPKILVMDSLDRLSTNFRGINSDDPTQINSKGDIVPEAQKNIDTLRKICGVQSDGKLVPGSSSKAVGTDAKIKPIPINEFYNVRDFVNPDDFWDEGEGKPSKELPRAVDPAHQNEKKAPKSPHVTKRYLWGYHYLSYFFGAGTHYIILESHHDRVDLASWNLSQGYVVANGQKIMYDRLKTNIQSGCNIVMLHNTGGVVQCFCSLRRELIKTPTPSASQILDAIHFVSPAPWSDQFGLPEVLMMLELQERAPMLFSQTVVDVDIFKDSSDTTLSNISCCFGGGGGVPELGLGNAEKLCIITAWKRHLILWFNAGKFEALANSLQWLMAVIALATTFVAVYATVTGNPAAAAAQALATDAMSGVLGDSSSGSGDAGSGSGAAGAVDPTDPVGLSVILLPLSLSFVGTIRTKQRPREKWATCLMSAHQIVQEIYKYRLRADTYDTTKQPAYIIEGDLPPLTQNELEIRAREIFVKTCSDIYSFAISTEVAKGGALQMGPMGKYQTQYSDERAEFLRELRKHCDRYLYRKTSAASKSGSDYNPGGGGGGPPGLLRKIFGKKNQIAAAADNLMDQASDALDQGIDAVGTVAGGTLSAANQLSAATVGVSADMPTVGAGTDDDGGGGDALGATKTGGKDDLMSQLAIETYIESRARCYIDDLERRAPVMAQRYNKIEFVSMLSNTAGAVLAVMGSDYSPWVPVTVALGSLASAVADYFYLGPQLAAHNRSLDELHNMILNWDSLSLVQRKKPSYKKEASITLETAILNVVAAKTSQPAALPNQAGGEDEE